MAQPVDRDWAAQRGQAALAKARALEAAAAAESAQAATLLAQFVDAVKAAGVAPVPLVAATFSGRSRRKTNLVGWYLRVNRSLGVDGDGAFYVLQAPDVLFARWRRATLLPSAPPMVVGKGGRDGESVDLPQLLATRLAELTGKPNPAN